MDRLTEGPPLGHDKEADVSVLGMGNGRRLGGVVLTEAGGRAIARRVLMRTSVSQQTVPRTRTR